MLGHELVKVSCNMFSWTLDKAEHPQVPFLNSGDRASGACTPLSGKLMTGCSPKREVVLGTYCVTASFPSIAKLYTRQYKKKAGKIVKRIS